MTDTIFKTKITRITGDSGQAIVNNLGQSIGTWGGHSRHLYSKAQPWNADETLILLDGNYGGSPYRAIFLDGSTYKPLYQRASTIPGQAGDHRWHPTDPKLLFWNGVVSGVAKFGTYNVATSTSTTLRSWSEYDHIDLGPGEGNYSRDGKMVAFLAHKKSDNHVYAFAYNIATNTTYTPLDLGVHSISDMSGESICDWVSISASGTYVVIQYTTSDTRVYDLNMKYLRSFNGSYKQNHQDLGIDNNGDDVASGRSNTYNKVITLNVSKMVLLHHY